MIGSQQLGDFRPCSKQNFQELLCDVETKDLYIFKVGFNNVMVKAPNAQKKIHCWRLKTLQVTQYADQNGARQKAVAEIKFDGQLIFTLLDMFNKKMGYQILEYVQNISNELRMWCQAPIKNIFYVTQRTEQKFGYKQGFVKVEPVLFYLQRSYYFQCRRWIGQIDSDILQIQTSQNVIGTSNYAGVFEYIYQQLKKQKAQRKLAQQQRRIKKLKEKQQMLRQKLRRQKHLQQKQHNMSQNQSQIQYKNSQCSDLNKSRSKYMQFNQ